MIMLFGINQQKFILENHLFLFCFNLFRRSKYTESEIDEIKRRVKNENEIDIVKTTYLTNLDKTIVYCEVKKTIYIAKKSFYKNKKRQQTMAVKQRANKPNLP